MPKLYQHQDGHYTIKRFVFGGGGIATYQVRAAGIDLLKNYGIDVDERGAELGGRLFELLQERDLLYTHGGGLSGTPWLRLLADAARAEGEDETLEGLRARELPAPQCAVLLTDDGWRLAVVFPEIPADWLRAGSINQWTKLLTKCSINATSSQNALQALRLWPGSGGAALLIEPSEQPYQLSPEGPWPDAWGIQAWKGQLPGLTSNGTVFTHPEEGGLRLRPGEATIAGSRYIVVLHRNRTRTPNAEDSQVPSDIPSAKLGVIGEWDALLVTADTNASPTAWRWFRDLDNPLRESVWRTSIITPTPTRYFARGVPVLRAGHHLVIGLTGGRVPTKTQSVQVVLERNGSRFANLTLPVSKQRRSPESRVKPKGEPPQTLYLGVAALPSGVYTFRGLTHSVVPLMFLVERAETRSVSGDAGSHPVPLSVRVGDHIAKAFEDGSCSTVVTLEFRKPFPEIEINAAVPVTVWCSQNQPFGPARQETPSVAARRAASELHRLLLRDRAANLYVEAGNFGKVIVRIERRAPDHEDAVRNAHRTKWLSATILALLKRPDIRILRLDEETQRRLHRTMHLPGGSILASLTAVPVPLWPHLRQLLIGLESISLGLNAARAAEVRPDPLLTHQ